MRMRAPDKGDVQQAWQHQVVDVLAAAFDQFGRIRPRHRLADIGIGTVHRAGVDNLVHDWRSVLSGAARPRRRGGFHRIDDGVVAGAAAVVAGQVFADFGARWPWVAFEQRGGRQQHAGRTVAALAGVAEDEGVLQVADFFGVGEALDGLDTGAVERSRQHQAAAHDAAVDPHRAGPADAVLATGVRAQQAELEAEKIDQVLARLDAPRDGLAVDLQRNLNFPAHWARASPPVARRPMARASSTWAK